MELTQRLECTQELYSDNNCGKPCPEQVGFLGICGTKYPLKKGPNKIGRDPQTCNIVLDLNSISRQHAVINILNNQNFMLMDLDSANKTRLADKKLEPYIPQLLKNGDMVQFGEVFGVFRLLEEENDLPMTQAMDIPDTPVHNRHISKVNIHATTIPESPEVSDKEDSFIAASQQKPKHVFKSPNNNFLKSSGKTIAIKPVGSNEIDNVFWASSKKSDSFNSQSNISNNPDDSVISTRSSDIRKSTVRGQSIHEMDTQIPKENVIKEIHDLDTQIPYENVTNKIHELDAQEPNVDPDGCVDSIYNATTQIIKHSPDIYEMETQLLSTEKLPEVRKIHNQENLQINFSIDNKENDIYNSETQEPFNDKLKLQKENVFNTGEQVKNDAKDISPYSSDNVSKPKLTSPSNLSDDIILFEEIETDPIDNDFESQQLLSPKLNVDKQLNDEEKDIPDSQVINFFPQKRANRIKSNSSTDCEDIDIAANQAILEITKKHADLTDCEGEANAILNTKNNRKKPTNIDEDVTDCEDVDENDVIEPNRVIEKDSFEDVLTQVLDDTNNENTPTLSKNEGVEDSPTQIFIKENYFENNQNTDISDFPTQVLDPEPQKGTCFEEALTQKIYSEELVQFKVPLQSSIKKKNIIDSNACKINDTTVSKSKVEKCSSIVAIEILDDDDEKYYAATQELFDDLCSQKQPSPNVRDETSVSKPSQSSSNESSDIERKVSDYVSNLSCSQIQEVVGVQKKVTPLKRMPSNGSDIFTSNKIDCLAILETKLPNTQEIKNGISLRPNSDTESLRDTDSEIDSFSDRSTPIKGKKQKVKMIQKIKINLSDKFDPESIPVRTSSRVRKPTTKIQNCDETFNDMAEKILKPVSIKEEHNKLSSKDMIEKSLNSKTKDERNKTKRNYSRNLEPETYEDNKSKRGRFAKELKKNDRKQKPKTNETVTDKLNEEANSIGTRRNTRSKQKEQVKRKNEPKSIPEKSRSEDNGKSSSKASRKTSKSPEMVKKNKPTRERSKSPEMIKKSKPTREGSKSLEMVKKSKPTRERSKSLEMVKKSKPTRGRSKSPEIVKKSKPTRERAQFPETIKKCKPSRKRSKSPEKELNRKSKEIPKSSEKIGTRITKKNIENSAVTAESEIRRSKRNRNKKSEEPIIDSKTKSPMQEQSVLYSIVNISPDTSSESPNRKRVAPSEIEKPTAKIPKLILRATPARKCKTQYVLFTAFACDEVKDKLEKLGAVVVSDVMTCTVVLTLQIKRTFKLLCAVGLGKPIVGPNWVQACADTNMIVDPWLYLLQDEATEKRFKFNLQRTLAGKRGFLKGFNVSSTPNVMPNKPEMKLIVECSGGKWQEGGAKWICVSTPVDRALWAGLREKGAVIVSTEFILGGVLTQKLDIEKNLL